MTRPIDRPAVTIALPRCRACGSANLWPYRSVTERDKADGNAIVWRQRHVLCRRCGAKFIVIAE